MRLGDELGCGGEVTGQWTSHIGRAVGRYPCRKHELVEFDRPWQRTANADAWRTRSVQSVHVVAVRLGEGTGRGFGWLGSALGLPPRNVIIIASGRENRTARRWQNVAAAWQRGRLAPHGDPSILWSRNSLGEVCSRFSVRGCSPTAGEAR